jgi:uncharacterized RDD family membrane protein YckC
MLVEDEADAHEDQAGDAAEAAPLHPAGSGRAERGAIPDDAFVQLASYGLRVGGYLVDWLLIFLFVQAALGHAGLSIQVRTAIAYGIRFVYATLLLRFLSGRTLGMRFFSLRCVRMDRSSPVTLLQAAYRSAAAELIAMTGLIGIVGLVAPAADLLWPAWDPESQTLHDKLAGTVVVR